jgi:hypothetical protein
MGKREADHQAVFAGKEKLVIKMERRLQAGSLLALGCVVVGEITLSLALRWNRNHIEGLNKEIQGKEKLSMQVLQNG